MSTLRANELKKLDDTNWVGTNPTQVPTNDMLGERGFEQAVDSVAALRLATFPASLERLWLSGYYGVGTAGGGPLYRDSDDTTTADNGGTVFVDGGGVRWRRVFEGRTTPEQFGATGDGVSDDSIRVQAALDYLGSAGGELRLGNATYLVSALGLHSGVSITGLGMDVSVFRAATNTAPVITSANESAITTGVTLSNFTADMNSTEGDVDASHSIIRLKNFRSLRLDDVKATNPRSHGFSMDQVQDAVVSRCEAHLTNTYTTAPDDGFEVTAPDALSKDDWSRNVHFHGCSAYGFNLDSRQSGFEIDDGAEGVTFHQCHGESNYATFTVHAHANSWGVEDISYVSCVSRNDTHGFRAHSRGPIISGLRYESCTVSGADIGFRFWDGGGVLTGSKVSRSVAESCTLGMLIEYPDLTVSNTEFTDVTTEYEVNVTDTEQLLFYGNTPELPPQSFPLVIEDDTGNPASWVDRGTGYRRDPNGNVYVQITIGSIDTTGMNAGETLRIRGLPGTNSGLERFASAAYCRDISFGSQLMFVVQENTDDCVLVSMASSGSLSSVTVGDITSGQAQLYVNITYPMH